MFLHQDIPFGFRSLQELFVQPLPPYPGGAQGNFVQSVTSSSFSEQQVILVMLFLALILENRAEYTWHRPCFSASSVTSSHTGCVEGGLVTGGSVIS